VPDQHQRGDRFGQGANALEQLIGAGSVQLLLQPDRPRRGERGSQQLERLACPLGRGAEDKLRLDSEPDKVLGDPPSVPVASWRKWPLVVAEGGIGLAGFRVS
jgi:hypothetical protein